MQVFKIPSHIPILYYFIDNNVAICDFREGCTFIQDLFYSSFPKGSSSQFKKKLRINHNKKTIRIKYTKDVACTHHGKVSPIDSDCIPFHVLFEEIHNVNELHGDDHSLYNNIINTYNTYTLEDFHQCVRLRVHSLLLIV
jgi:hypothetical protein